MNSNGKNYFWHTGWEQVKEFLGTEKELKVEIGAFLERKTLKNMRLIQEINVLPNALDTTSFISKRIPIEDFPTFDFVKLT